MLKRGRRRLAPRRKPTFDSDLSLEKRNSNINQTFAHLLLLGAELQMTGYRLIAVCV